MDCNKLKRKTVKDKIDFAAKGKNMQKLFLLNIFIER